MKRLFILWFCLALASGAQSQQVPLRTLIVSGGPSVGYNQYAIESNARYVERLTNKGPQRILFADGKRQSRTILTWQEPANWREQTVLAWILGETPTSGRTVMRAPTLKRLDGDARPRTIVREVQNLAKNIKSGEQGLLYFTGHGSAGKKGGLFGFFTTEDYENTLYNGWHGDLSMQQLGVALKNWPVGAPLTLVMVQCHDGGFANLIWPEGDIQKDVWPRDFCGFFATTGERMAAGCTSEVDEHDYEDFTTHFFAALSGVSREGRRVTGADYDYNGAVSGLEALAYANLNDDSIDVPLCTSDFYLHRIFDGKRESGNAWLQTPFSAIYKSANSWQKAILNGLSRDLKLTGEMRLRTAFAVQQNLKTRLQKAQASGDYEEFGKKTLNDPQVSRHFYTLEAELLRRFPALKSKLSSSYSTSQTKAIAFLKTRRQAVDVLYAASEAYDNAGEIAEVREAKLSRFLRAAHTVVLQKRLHEQGTSEQKAVFTRLRTAEGRNFLTSR